jgi:hypothetical protein
MYSIRIPVCQYAAHILSRGLDLDIIGRKGGGVEEGGKGGEGGRGGSEGIDGNEKTVPELGSTHFTS